MTTQLTYDDARARLDACGLLVDGSAVGSDFPVGMPTDDSRMVTEGATFVAIRGTKEDGHKHIRSALKSGARCIVHETDLTDVKPVVKLPEGVATLHVRSGQARAALAELAAMATGNPGADLLLVATTGTNGKTTTATLIAEALTGLGTSCGFVGTTGYRVARPDGGEPVTLAARHTTPSAPTLYGLLADMREAGCTACSMEASSHAIHQHRFRVEDVDVAVFTNLTRDHLDYHGSEDAYFSAKKMLFDGLGADRSAVVNADDPRAMDLVADCPAQVLTYGSTPYADIQWTLHASTADGLDLTVDGHRARYPLAGSFNAANLTACYAALRAAGHASTDIFPVLEASRPVEGRFEVVSGRSGVKAVIDYAHTPDALEQVLRAARDITPENKRLWVVFGCGGDRDRGKRPLMARTAERLADRVIVTSDNPRNEDPDAIIEEIMAGFMRPWLPMRVTDRAEAIGLAMRSASAGEVVVVAGKGHETYQEIGDERTPFDDHAHVLASSGN
ncbi:MAG: UDP-N-acetylmuramoyl-L-alanyl-D-glutamate--2,6-diaminopimelate ligase [Rhodothermales bacterium]